MKNSREKMKISYPNALRGYKPPKLVELYEFVFPEDHLDLVLRSLDLKPGYRNKPAARIGITVRQLFRRRTHNWRIFSAQRVFRTTVSSSTERNEENYPQFQ
jgi:hypothetical protein